MDIYFCFIVLGVAGLEKAYNVCKKKFHNLSANVSQMNIQQQVTSDDIKNCGILWYKLYVHKGFK